MPKPLADNPTLVDDARASVRVDIQDTLPKKLFLRERKAPVKPAGVSGKTSIRKTISSTQFHISRDTVRRLFHLEKSKDVVVALARFIFALPAPLMLLYLLISPPSVRTSATTNTIWLVTAQTAMTTFSISKILVGMRPWNRIDTLETICIVGSCLASSLIICWSTFTLVDGPFTSFDWITSVCLIVFVHSTCHIVIVPNMARLGTPQLIAAQREAFTGYIAWLIKQLLLLLALGFSLLGYAGFTMETIPTDVANLIPFIRMAMSLGYSCASFGAFKNATGYENASSMQQDPKLACGTNADWCGYGTWVDACWAIGLAPVVQGMHYDINIMYRHATALFGITVIFIGRGSFKFNPAGGIDSASMRFMLRKNVVAAMLTFIAGSGICIYHFARFTLNGVMLVTPKPVDMPPSIVYPAQCVGMCDFLVFIVWLVLLTVTILASFLDLIPDKFLCINNREHISALALGAQKSGELLTTEEKAQIMAHLDALVDPTKSKMGRSKFTSRELVTGNVLGAAKGLDAFLCLTEDEERYIHANGEKAIVEEVAALGDHGVSAALNYVLYEATSEKKFPNGVRDVGRVGWVLEDFMKQDSCKRAGLRRPHVIALRLYTTHAYKAINDPLRDEQRLSQGHRHPLAAVVKYISEGIKKLRAIVATEAANDQRYGRKMAHENVTLWRGLKKVHVGNAFIANGGTELAPMSTTSNIAVAIEYGTCLEGSLLFKIKVPNALKHGADLQWLSAFPGEAEVLYPPLTFLQPCNRRQELTSDVSGATVTILEVEPDLSS